MRMADYTSSLYLDWSGVLHLLLIPSCSSRCSTYQLIETFVNPSIVQNLNHATLIMDQRFNNDKTKVNSWWHDSFWKRNEIGRGFQFCWELEFRPIKSIYRGCWQIFLGFSIVSPLEHLVKEGCGMARESSERSRLLGTNSAERIVRFLLSLQRIWWMAT